MVKTSFDTELFSVFEEDQEVAILGNYKLEFFMQTNKQAPPFSYSGYYGNRDAPSFHIYKLRESAADYCRGENSPKDWEKEEDKWEHVGDINSYSFYRGVHQYPPKDWETKGFILKELEEEMAACIEKQRKIRNRELAKERAERNAAEAAAKGMTVEDYMFSKKVVKTEKRQNKNVEALKKQVAASFAYGKSLDKLEKELKKFREMVETHQIERLNLRVNTGDFDYKVRDMIQSFNYFIKLHPPLDAEPTEKEETKPKSGRRRRR